MGATRLPLLCAFAGGCLSGVVLLLGVWRAETAAAIPAQKQLARSNELLAAAIAASNAGQRRELAPREPVSAEAPARMAEVSAEPPASKDTPELASAAPTPAGSAVSDVLMDLEAAYRKRLVAAAPADAPAAPEPPPTPAPSAIVAAEPPRSVVAPPAPVAVVVAVAASPAVAPAEVAPPAPVAAGFAASAPAVPAPPALVAQNDARSPDIHYGDVNQNTYITNVRQGDVYVMQQQIAMMQYMQLLGAAGVVQPAHSHFGRGMAPRAVPQAAPQYRQFPSTLTNPDNPWGFNFAPPNLVH